MTEDREPRTSELVLNTIFNQVRNLDKMLWSGKRCFVAEIWEDVEQIKKNLDRLEEEFEKEVENKSD